MRIGASSFLLRFRYPKRNLRPVCGCDECALLFRSGETSQDVTESNTGGEQSASALEIFGSTPDSRVTSNTKLRTPFLSNRLAQPRHSRLSRGIIGLARIAIDAARARNVDDVPRLTVLDSKVWRRCPHQPEGRCAVQVQDCIPLLVRHLVYYAVPSEASIIDYDVDLPIAELGRFLDEGLDARDVHHVARNGECLAAA